MRRIAIGSVLVLSLLLMPAAKFPSAQEETKRAKPEIQPTWKQVSAGVWRTELGPDRPDIAVLQLSDEEFKEFFKDPKDYLNSHNVFPKKVNKVEAAGEDPPSTGGGWTVAVIHTPYSTASYVAWPLPSGT